MPFNGGGVGDGEGVGELVGRGVASPTATGLCPRAETETMPAETVSVEAEIMRIKRDFWDMFVPSRKRGALMPLSLGLRSAAFRVPRKAISRNRKGKEGPPMHWHVGDAQTLAKRATTKALASWGRADQLLPKL